MPPRIRPEYPVAVLSGYRYPSAMDRLGTRINLTLPTDVVEVLDRLGKLTGAGRATIIREWLVEAQPLFAEMARAAELAAARNIDALDVMAKTLREAGSQVDQMQLDIRAKRRAAMRKRRRD